MSGAAKLHWYWNRLRLMGPAEIAYRARQTARKRWAAVLRRWRVPPVPQPSLQAFGRPWCERLPQGLDPAPYVEAAEQVLAGRWRVFALEAAPLGFPPAWNTCPRTGTRAPMAFGKSIDYRDDRVVGDIKYLWEPARHLELTTLAQAWHLTRQPRYLDGCRSLLASWFEQCPYPQGVHWASSLELAIRLLNWAFAWHLLGGAGSPLFEGEEGRRLQAAWLGSVHRHAGFIQGFLSRHSSANNHLLGEYMGLYVAGLTWPCWPVAQRWRRQGKAGFEQEALRQNAPDGVNREQAVYYQHEVADMMLLCGLLAERHDDAFAPAYWERLERMLGFIAAVRDAGGHVPMIGDADDALMVRLDPSPRFDPYRSLLATGAALFGRTDFGVPAEGDAKTRWLLGDGPALRLPSRAGPATAFPEGGYWVLGDRFGAAGEVKIVADAGPLGYLSLAAHGHADALAFTLSVDGAEVLVDPGTFAYHTQPRWRNYFRGTSAHNTLRVDGLDQSVIGGNFMWLQKASARCLGVQDDAGHAVWEAEHDGYRRLRDPVVHRRRLAFDKASRVLEVTDTIDCRGAHEVELFWHFAEGCSVTAEGSRVRVRVAGKDMALLAPGREAGYTVHQGEEQPPLGWISRRFDRRTPIATVRESRRIEGRTVLVTRIEWAP